MSEGSHAGRVAVVTGGANGIGQVFAKQLAADGADIALADLADTTETVSAIEQLGRRAVSISCDVTDPDAVAAFAGAVEDAFGRCDILINNVGIFPNQPFDEITFEDWRRVMSTNLDSMFLMAKAFVPGMKARGWGRIVNMASNTFNTPVTGYAHYVASKGGVVGFTRALASDLGEHGITVNAIAPSLVRTHGTMVTEPREEARFEAVASFQAIKRTQQPDDLAGAMAFLTSDQAAFITGQTYYVDGGWVRT